MAETLSGVNGEILRWAREFYNMNAEDAAKAIGVDVERYCNWETGTDHPTYAKLRKINEAFRKPSAVFFFPTPPQLPPIKGDLRTLPDDVVNRFSKNIIIQFEKAKVYQMSLKELYSDRESIFMHKDAFPADATALCDYFRTALAFPIAAQKARKSTKVVFEIYREKFYKNSQAKQAAGGCQPHGNLTPAHADGCAARCFEGVQCGSIFKGADGHGQQSAALFLNNVCFAPSPWEDHGGRCPIAHTGTNVPVCSIPAAIAALFNVQHRLLISLHQPSSL